MKVDENSPPVHVDEAARARLARAFERPEVVAAYLFGSQATGAAGHMSDADVAVLVDESLAREDRLDLQLKLSGEAVRALRTSEVDLVLLNDASPLLRHRVLRDGVLLVDHRPRDRNRFVTQSLLTYFDTRPLRAELSRGLRNRMREDRYGRR